jgi:phytoene synthase
LDAALAGDCAAHAVWPAFRDAVERFGIPSRYFHDILDGVSSDLERHSIATFDELYRYCYQVASAVGLSVVHVFGFETADALPMAEKCGVAFQLTNILRDVGEDAAMGRVYLPAEDLSRFGVEPGLLRDGRATREFRELMRFEAARARGYYREAAPLVGYVHPRSRASLRALIRIYSRLLERIEEADFDVFRRRIRVPAWEKLYILLRGLAGPRA